LGAKTTTIAKLRGRFYSFFLRGPKSQLRESYGAKTAIKPTLNYQGRLPLETEWLTFKKKTKLHIEI